MGCVKKKSGDLIHSDVVAKIVEHGNVAFDGDASGGEHVARDGGIGTRLKGFYPVVAHGVSTCGDSDCPVGDDEADDGNDASFFLFSHGGEVLIGGAGDGGEEVDGG